MKIQVNSDKTIAVDASLIRFVESEAKRILGRFADQLTRVEVHLSDVNSTKPGQADKRCLVEARPRRAQPLSASANAAKMASAIGKSLGKMQRSLTTFFGRKGRPAAAVSKPARGARRTVAASAAVPPATVRVPGTKTAVTKASVQKKTAVKTPAKLSPRGPKKKGIYQARRKPWPTR
jgi:ribosome-associated translation inhibitor RaiA